MTRSIRIAVPAYSGEIAASTVVSLLRARDEAKARGWACEVVIRPGDSLLLRARNVMLAEFLKSNATDLVFWDSDVATVPGGFARLCEHPVNMVAGAYRFRADPEAYPLRLLPGARISETGLMEVEAVGAGFLRITRAAVERMIEAYPDRWVDDRHAGRIPWLFDFETRDRQMFSEDFVFCRAFRGSGGRVYIDARLPMHHTGGKIFTGIFADHYGRELAAATTAAELAAAKASLDAAFAEALTA